MDYTKFFARKSREVAIDLLGMTLARDTKKGFTAARILETRAYEGGRETHSRQGMKYAPGRLFLMPHRGRYLLNIATDTVDYPSCVEIRRIGLHNREVGGASNVANLFGITFEFDNVPLGREVQISGESLDKSNIGELVDIVSDNCVGYFLIIN